MFTKYYFLYKTVNTLNDMEYIGVHSTFNIDDSYMGSGKLITEAIQTFGKENFRRDIIKFFDTEEEAYTEEEKIVTTDYIKLPNTYNVTPGGRKPPSRLSKKHAEKTLEQLKKIANTPEKKLASSIGGKKGAQHIIENGWSKEALEKRVKTYKENGKYSDMSACHTTEAICKRSETRRKKRAEGIIYRQSVPVKPETIAKREVTKYKKLLQKISNYYMENMSLELLFKAQTEQITYITTSALMAYLTEDDICRISYLASPEEPNYPQDNQ